MKTAMILAAFLVFITVPLEARILKYVDDQGKLWYTDREDAIPEQYRDQINADRSSGEPKAPPNTNTRRQAPRARPPESPSMQAPRAGRSVEIYVAPNCFRCKVLETFLDKRKIRYSKYDITVDDDALQKYNSYGQPTLPLVIVGEKVITGYNPQAILKELKR